MSVQRFQKGCAGLKGRERIDISRAYAASTKPRSEVERSWHVTAYSRNPTCIGDFATFLPLWPRQRAALPVSAECPSPFAVHWAKRASSMGQSIKASPCPRILALLFGGAHLSAVHALSHFDIRVEVDCVSVRMHEEILNHNHNTCIYTYIGEHEQHDHLCIQFLVNNSECRPAVVP